MWRLKSRSWKMCWTFLQTYRVILWGLTNLRRVGLHMRSNELIRHMLSLLMRSGDPIQFATIQSETTMMTDRVKFWGLTNLGRVGLHMRSNELIRHMLSLPTTVIRSNVTLNTTLMTRRNKSSKLGLIIWHNNCIYGDVLIKSHNLILQMRTVRPNVPFNSIMVT